MARQSDMDMVLLFILIFILNVSMLEFIHSQGSCFHTHCYSKEEITLTLLMLWINSQVHIFRTHLMGLPMTHVVVRVRAMAGIHVFRYIRQQNNETAAKKRGGRPR